MEKNAKSTPVGKPILHIYLSVTPRKESWNHRTSVGMLTYLQGNNFPETSITVHQTERLCNNPMLSHEKSIN